MARDLGVKEIDTLTVVANNGLWHLVEITIKDNQIINKTVSVGDTKLMTCERAMKKLLEYVGV